MYEVMKRMAMNSRCWLPVLLALSLAVALAEGSASAKLIWRDGRWVKAEEPEGIEKGPGLEAPSPLPPEAKPIPEVPPTGRPPIKPAKPARFRWPWSSTKTDADLFSRAKTDYQQGRFRSASRDFKRLVKRFPQSPYCEEARWLRGEALFKRRKYYAAFQQYENLLDKHAGTARFAEALHREFEIAHIYFGPTRRKFWGIPFFSGDVEAVEILRNVIEKQPGGELADDAVLSIAGHYYDHFYPMEAEHYYAKYVKDFPEREHAREALMRAAQCAIASCKGSRYDTSSLSVARERLLRFQDTYPEDEKKEDVAKALSGVRLLEAEKEYKIAVYYRRAGNIGSAAFYAERVMKNYGNTPWAKWAAELLEKMSDKGGRKK